MPREKDDSELPGIVVLYTSLMILLLAFFILLNTMSVTEEARVEAAFQSLVGSFGFKVAAPNPMQSDTKMRLPAAAPLKKVDRDYRSLRGLVRDENLDGLVKLLRSERFRTLVMPDLLLFEPGRVELSAEGQEFLSKVAELVRDGSYPMSVVGHTDEAPPALGVAYNNWELSGMRALKVVKFLIAQGLEPTRLAALGKGQYEPLVKPRADDPRALLFNNRVELVMDARDPALERMPETSPQRNLNLRGFRFDFWDTGKKEKVDQTENEGARPLE